MLVGQLETVCHYYVDEAGDSTLFASRGRVLVGEAGCSRYFILGYVEIPHPEEVDTALRELRSRLNADPYFQGVPSFQPEARKTSVAFHAKDDLPEVRREVFALLLQQEFAFHAVVKDKRQVLRYVQKRSATDSTYRYSPNELYEYLTRTLFKNEVHKANTYEIYFSKRGKSDRSAALRAALEHTSQRFQRQSGVSTNSALMICEVAPAACSGVQVTDYMLWALQRYYERGEDRYIRYIWPKCSLIRDLDDVRRRPYGEYYSKRRPLGPAPDNRKPAI
ncbi:MAG: DUF3800 domain-containing protein [Anaerolineales bacterium]